MKEFKLLIAGGTNFTDIHVFTKMIETMAETLLKNGEISFVCSMAPGADAMAYMYAHQHGIKCYEFNLNRRLAGDPVMRVHAEMANFSDGALIFCEPDDDVDYMIDYMQRQNKKVAVVHYST